MRRSNVRYLASAAAIVAVLVLALFVALAPIQPVGAQNTACYRPVGGASFECKSGGAFVVKDGATLEVQSGGTLTIAAGATAALGPDIVAAVSDMTLDAITSTVATLGTTSVTDLVVSNAAVIAGTATITEDVSMVADLVVGGNIDATGNVEVVDHLLTQAELYLIPPATQTVVNGGTITGTGGIVELTSGGAVTASLVAPGDGQVLILVNVGSNAINVVDTGTTKLSTDAALGATDTLMLVGVGTTWYEVSRGDN